MVTWSCGRSPEPWSCGHVVAHLIRGHVVAHLSRGHVVVQRGQHERRDARARRLVVDVGAAVQDEPDDGVVAVMRRRHQRYELAASGRQLRAGVGEAGAGGEVSATGRQLGRAHAEPCARVHVGAVLQEARDDGGVRVARGVQQRRPAGRVRPLQGRAAHQQQPHQALVAVCRRHLATQAPTTSLTASERPNSVSDAELTERYDLVNWRLQNVTRQTETDLKWVYVGYCTAAHCKKNWNELTPMTSPN